MSRSLKARVTTAASEVLTRQGFVTPIDICLGLGWLHGSNVDDWRHGRVGNLEYFLPVHDARLTELIVSLHRWAEEHGLQATEAEYISTTRSRRPLRFLTDGAAVEEAAWRTRWVSRDLPAQKRERIAKTQDSPRDLVVVMPVRDWACAECQGTGDLLIMDDNGPPAAAVSELLDYAESADSHRRLTAMAFAMNIGPEGAPAWREWAGRPGFGAYARMWLTEQGEEVPEHPGDQAWLTVEALSAADAAIPPELTPLLLGAALANTDAPEAAEVLSLMRDSGHPDAARFVESIAAATGILPPAVRPVRSAGLPGGEVYQLKITLRGVSKPPVWRRVAIPAALTLDLLHEVIQQVMGWEDGRPLAVLS